LNQVRTLSGGSAGSAAFAHVYAVSGQPGEARKLLAQLQQLAQQRYVSADAIALIHAGLGEQEQAFAWLDKAYTERSSGLVFLKVEPRFDSLRADPRFADLLRRMKLAP
jgi:hypothetical protein